MFDTLKLDIDMFHSKLTPFEVRYQLNHQGFRTKHHDYTYDDNRPYSRIENHTKGYIKVGVCYSRRPEYYTYPEMILTFHLSHYDSFNAFVEFVGGAFQEQADYILNKAEIIRLDCCFETQDVKIERIHTNFRRKYAHGKNHRVYGDI